MNNSKLIFNLSSRQLLILTAVLVFEIIITTTLYLTLLQKEKETIALDFKSTSKELISAIEKEVSLNLEALVSIKSLYSVTDSISREQFRSFNSNVLNRVNSIQAFGWIPKVQFEEKTLFESIAHNDGLIQFRITERLEGKMIPVRKREVYYPVFYLEPFIGNEKALGFDLASDRTRLSALEKAIESDDLAATARITLVQEKGTQKGILVACPYRKQGKLIGLFTGVFRIEDLVNRALSNLINKDCNLDVYDISAEEGNQHLARLYEEDTPAIPDNATFDIPVGIHYQQKIKIVDRDWLILSTPTQFYLNSYPNSAVLILIVCIILSIGIFYFFYRSFKEMNQRKNIERKIINSIIFSQEQDREYFAEDLHEGLAQMLAGLSFHIHAVESKLKNTDDDALKKSLSLIKGYIFQSLENTKNLAKDLMPRLMMKYGLIASIDQHIDNLKITSDLNIEFNADVKNMEIDKEIEITLYRSIVAIIEKIKASTTLKNISIEINDDESNFQVIIEMFGQMNFINEFNVRSNTFDFLHIQKRIELQGGQMIVNQEAKRISIIMKFKSQLTTANKR